MQQSPKYEEIIDELEEKILLKELENHQLKQQMKVYEFEEYKLNEIQTLSKAGTWELNHLSYDLKLSKGMSALLFEEESLKTTVSWHEFLDLLVNDNSSTNIKDLLLNDVIKNAEELTLEHSLKNFKNETLFVRHNCKTFYNTLGHPLITVGLILDITEQVKNQAMIFHQSKVASLGEMLGNIAHQWRQPLSVIASISTGVKLKKEYGALHDEDLFKNMDDINKTTQHLSQTIDDFRSFFLADSSKELRVNLEDVIEKVLSLIQDSYKSSNIEIIKHYNKPSIAITCNKNLLIQALINIFNNAKDALNSVENKNKKFVFINMESVENNVFLEIRDNANGIPEDLLDKIFDPYFTTKHKSQGTGIGLYMTNQIVTKHLKSKIFVENIHYTYQNIEYVGASFKIRLEQ